MEEKRGHIGYLKNGIAEAEDIYRAVLPRDGTLKILMNGTNRSGASGYLYLYAYDSRKGSGQIFANFIGKKSNVLHNETVYDTILLHGRAADTIYFKVASAGAFSYNLQYDLTDTSQNDVEPNNTYAQSISINYLEEKHGHIGYQKGGVSDATDYYRTILPHNGTLKILVQGQNRSGASSYLYMYAYDSRQGSGQIMAKYLANNADIKADLTIYDTIYLYGRAADTAYFAIASPSAWSYSFKYDLKDTGDNDLEPNDDFITALPINSTEIIKGHIGYFKKGTGDANDFYITQLPTDGTLQITVQATNRSGANGYLYMYAYDKRQGSGQILAKYVSNSSTIANDSTIYDTIKISCRAADTVYFKITSAGAFTYRFTYQMVDTSVNDAEPNNTFETATLTAFNVKKDGHIGYLTNGTSDGQDYYRVLPPAKGSVRIITEAVNTSASSGYIYVTGFDRRKAGGQIFARYLGNNSNLPANTALIDTFEVACTSTDTFYYRITSSGCFAYSVRFEHISRQPKADLTYERLGNTVGFRPQLSNADSFLWSFGDGSSTTVQYPMHTYSPGGYNARLIAVNSACNYKDTAQTFFEIKGVEYFTPTKSGVGGDVVLEVYGGGLDTTTVVKLLKGAVTIYPEEKYTNTLKNHLSNVFNLHLAEVGMYDVVIEIPGEPIVTYPNGFEMTGFSYPYVSSDIQGPSRWRVNSDTRFSLVLNNPGSVMSSSTITALVWPKTVSIQFEPKFITLPVTGSETVIVDDTAYTLPHADYHFIYDSLNTSVAIDSFAGQPYDGYIRFLLIPHVPAGTTLEFPFIARTTVAGAISLKTYTLKPNLRGSCETPNWQNHSDDLTAELIDGADMIVDKTNIPLLKAFTKTAKIGQKHGASLSSYAGKHFWAWYDGYEVDSDAAMSDWLQETEANNAFALQTATDELGNFMLDQGLGKLSKTYQNQVDFINKRLANNPAMSPELASKYIDKLNALSKANGRLEGLEELYKNTKDLATLSDKLLKLQQLAEECPELKPQVEELTKQLDKELHQRDVKDKPTNPVVSMDPNEITGPDGQGTARYLHTLEKQHFQVSFENLATASAAAQIVRIRDTLDVNKYNLSSFEFRGISVGRQYFRIPRGRKQFVIERKVSAVNNMLVRINASVDTLTGVIDWQFTAINSTTKNLPVFEGFLPPNNSRPEGEGTVSYSVTPRAGLPSGTVFSNRASIVFDANKAILTNSWQNTLDIEAPTSSLQATVSNVRDINIKFAGSDALSGVGYYNLHVSVNNGPWINFSGSQADTMSLIGEYDSTYRFYVTTQDKVGNLENKVPGAEATLTIEHDVMPITLVSISATNVGERNRIDFTTATESKGDYTEIEKSSNTTNFTTMATVAAKGTPGAYSLYDQNALFGRTYYRLKMYDADGKYTYSNIVSAFKALQGEFVLEAFPNPVKDKLLLRIIGERVGRATVQLVTVTGSVIKRENIVNNTTSIDLSGLATGVYFLRYTDSNRMQVIRVTKH